MYDADKKKKQRQVRKHNSCLVRQNSFQGIGEYKCCRRTEVRSFLLVLISFSLNYFSRKRKDFAFLHYRGRKNKKWIAANALLSSHYINVLLTSPCAWQPEFWEALYFCVLITWDRGIVWIKIGGHHVRDGRYYFSQVICCEIGWKCCDPLLGYFSLLSFDPLLLAPCITNWSRIPVFIGADQKGFFLCYLRRASVVILLHVNWGQCLVWGRDHFP